MKLTVLVEINYFSKQKQKTSSLNHFHAVLKGFFLCKIAYTFKKACLTDLSMNLGSFLIFFCVLSCFCLIWMTLRKRGRDLFMLAAEQTEKMGLPCMPQHSLCQYMQKRESFSLTDTVLHCSYKQRGGQRRRLQFYCNCYFC